MSTYLFTSESVSAGHPDKIADQISDAILDAVITQDIQAKVAAETLVKTGLVVLAGEISTTANINYAQVARTVINDIGYNKEDYGFAADSCGIITTYDQQSPDISMGVHNRLSLDDELNQGAGDQGLMFGYACDETASYMPFAIYYAHRLMERHSHVRKTNILPWLRPDAKTQITVIYDNDTGKCLAIDTVVLSTQHDPNINNEDIYHGVMEEIIKPILPQDMLTPNTKFLINPTGRFVIGGPKGDCGLTGRKIIVDTYGGAALHGGGAFSGKDPSKADRSAAYVARYIAKNTVASKIASFCQIQIAYAIGVAQPVSINIHSDAKISNRILEKVVRDNFDLRPRAIIKYFDLLRPIYRNTSNYGHFGRAELPWEKTDKIAIFQNI